MDIRIGAANVNGMELGKMPGLGQQLNGAGSVDFGRALDGASRLPGHTSIPAGGSSLDSSFMDTLQDAVHAVEGLQSDAAGKVQQVLTGTDGQELHTTMIAVEKADLAFQLMMQVRNKIVQAYQEVARMPF